MDADKIKYWISKGAKPSGTMHNLLISKKIIEGKKVNVLSRKSPIKSEEALKAEAEAKAQAAAPKAEPKTEAPATEVTPAPSVDAQPTA